MQMSPAADLSEAKDIWPKVAAKPTADLISVFPRALDCSLWGLNMVAGTAPWRQPHNSELNYANSSEKDT